MKAILVFLGLFSTSLMASESLNIWQEYFPNMDCEQNNCARGVPALALAEALERASYFRPEKLRNYKHMMVVDFTMHSSKERGFLINLKDGSFRKYIITHGINSGDNEGNAIRFSNTPNSKQSSLGLYETKETYSGKYGRSLRLEGLEPSNDMAYERAIVIHKAKYASKSYVWLKKMAGRSWGCPAVSSKHKDKIVDALEGGALYYIYHQ